MIVVITSVAKNFIPIIGIIFYVTKIGDYLKILTDDDVKDFVDKNLGKYFKFKKEKLCSKLNEEQNLQKVVESLIYFSPHLTKYNHIVEMIQSSSCDNVYITLISTFWIFLIQNCNWLTLNQWSKKIKRIAKSVEKV